MLMPELFCTRMTVGKLPTEYRISRGEGEYETIFICETALVPSNIPPKTVFISKEKASINDFIQLFLLYDESFETTTANFAVLALGAFDISTKEKYICVNKKTHIQEFLRQPNLSKKLVIQQFNILLQMIREIKGAKKIASTDPLSCDSNGFHNDVVFDVSKKVEQVDENHTHLVTKPRFQKWQKKKKEKGGENHPLIQERFIGDGVLVESEKRLLVQATLRALETEGNDVVVDGYSFKRKF